MKNTVAAFRQRQIPKAPRELAKPGRSLWQAIQLEYTVDDPGGLAYLLTACRSEDDIASMRATIAADGNVVTDRFNQKIAHPLLAAIGRAETTKRQALRALNLDVTTPAKVGRPTGRPNSR